MDQYITGAVIRELREKKHLTQAELAEKLNVSDKTVSKWETGKGYPDITLLEPIAGVFSVSVAELISGNVASNRNPAADMLRTEFYVCPVCGNVITGTGRAAISCHGVQLIPAEAEEAGGAHTAAVEMVEDEYLVCIEHPMTKRHYVFFIAALSPDRVQLVKLYPEWSAGARFKIHGVKKLLFYCNRDGMFSLTLN